VERQGPRFESLIDAGPRRCNGKKGLAVAHNLLEIVYPNYAEFVHYGKTLLILGLQVSVVYGISNGISMLELTQTLFANRLITSSESENCRPCIRNSALVGPSRIMNWNGFSIAEDLQILEWSKEILV
jgi:hypothetical protein